MPLSLQSTRRYDIVDPLGLVQRFLQMMEFGILEKETFPLLAVRQRRQTRQYSSDSSPDTPLTPTAVPPPHPSNRNRSMNHRFFFLSQLENQASVEMG